MNPMMRFARWALIPAMLCTWLLAAGPASAQNRAPAREVQDEAGFFSPAAVQKANAVIAEIHRAYKKDVLIETFVSAPADAKSLDLSNKNVEREYFQKWAARRFKSDQVDGIYVLICKDPKWVQPAVGQRTRELGIFTNQNRDELGRIFLKDLHAGKPDEALLQAVNYVRDTLRTHAQAVRGNAQVFPVPPGQVHQRGAPVEENDWRSHIFGWVCLGIVALLVIWLVFGLIRAFTTPRGGYMGGPGGGPGGPGYGGGGYGGGYGGGGGGGGFMTGLLGGMFGAVAGNWMYNNMFGGHSGGGGWGASSAQGAAPGSTDAGSDVGSDPSVGGGGDYGDSGGDQGGGGGDWGGGGGGDAGGGGDWGGGGGGDAGGGGDWGGGGGDFGGGGGGDFGGGGGGGDW